MNKEANVRLGIGFFLKVAPEAFVCMDVILYPPSKK